MSTTTMGHYWAIQCDDQATALRLAASIPGATVAPSEYPSDRFDVRLSSAALDSLPASGRASVRGPFPEGGTIPPGGEAGAALDAALIARFRWWSRNPQDPVYVDGMVHTFLRGGVYADDIPDIPEWMLDRIAVGTSRGMNREIKSKWILALRSGEYPQGEYLLRDWKGRYTALGVLAEIATAAGACVKHDGRYGVADGWMYGGRGLGDYSSVRLPSCVEQWAELGHSMYTPSGSLFGTRLIDVSDFESFAYASDWIEKNL